MVVSEILSPFVRPIEMWLYRAGHYVVFASMYLALLLRVDISDEHHQSQHVRVALIVLCSTRRYRWPGARRKRVDSEEEIWDGGVFNRQYCSVQLILQELFMLKRRLSWMFRGAGQVKTLYVSVGL